MIDGISAISAIQPIDYTRKVVEAQAGFAIPASALRTDDVSPVGGVAERDPVADSVELSINFPQMVNPTYGPPPVEQTLGLRRNGEVDEVEDAAARENAGTEELPVDAEDAEDGDVDEAQSSGEKGADGQALEEGEQEQLRELKARDREVRAHEQAHQSVGGQYAGSMSFEYQQGPDGNKYAVGGEVSIDTSAERDPEATIAKMQQVKAAAMAPAEPSGQDRSVAAQASQTEMQARQQLAEETRAENEGDASETDETGETEEGEATGAGAAEGTGEAGAVSGSRDGVAGASEDSNVSGISFGGEASFSSNPFVNRYAEGAYSMQSSASSYAALSGYSPIDIVA